MKTQTSDTYKTIVFGLEKHADKEGAEIASRYHKYPGYKSYGLLTQVLRRLLKHHKKYLQSLDCHEAFLLAEKCYASHIEEQVLSGNYVLQLHIDCLTPSSFDYLDKMLDHFSSWSQVDDICAEGGKILNTLLLKYPKETTALLGKWNKSKNMWKKRASIVSFTRKVGQSGKFTEVGLKLCDNLIWDKEDLVQKAVGWTLKDLMRGDRQKVLNYVKKIRKQGAPSTITLYAIRDLKGKQRQEVLDI